MKTIIRKELRESLVLGVLGLIIFSLMLLQQYRDSSSAMLDLASQSYYGQLNDKVQPLLSSGFVTMVSFFCGIFGAVLGWKQIFAERHRDLQAFLIHRPATRNQIFWAKTAAGMLVYLSAAGIPLLCLVTWAQYPGHLAVPFEWQMAIPAFGLCGSGLVFYFAGMLTGLRQARWYVSRGLGLAAAAVVCVAVAMSSSLWQPAVAVGVGLAVLATAAWGAFETSGYYQGQPAQGKVALIVSLTVGSAAALVFLFALGSTFVSANEYSWNYHTMGTNGVIYKVTPVRGKQPEIVDLDGKPLLDEKTGRMMQMEEFNRRLAPARSLNVDFEALSPGAFAEPSRYFLLWGATPDTVWYYWTKYGRLVGYDLLNRRVIGSIGPNGFVTRARDGLDRFELPRNHNLWIAPGLNLLNTADTVYASELGARAVKPVFKTTPDDPIGGSISVQSQKESEEGHSVLTATRHQIYLIRPGGATAWKIPYQPSYPDYTAIRLCTLPELNQFAVWFEPSFARNLAKSFKLPTHVMWLSNDGAVGKSVEVPSREAPEGWGWKTLLIVAACCASICLPVGLWLCRRFAMPVVPTLGWMLFLLVTGFVGLLVFLCVNEWPAREPCPACGRRRVVTREKCEHCGATFAPPQKVGIEIFESAAA